MAKPISQALWNNEFPGKPMPEGITMEEFHAACDVLDRQKDMVWAKEYMEKMDRLIDMPWAPELVEWAKAQKLEVVDWLSIGG